jgi:hypothetical protein
MYREGVEVKNPKRFDDYLNFTYPLGILNIHDSYTM